MSNFSIGQKVVCVDDTWHPWILLTFDCPYKGRIYTIRDKVTCPQGVGLLFEEVVNPPIQFRDSFGEPVWGADFFRPLVSKQTDISIFQKMLDDASQKMEDA